MRMGMGIECIPKLEIKIKAKILKDCPKCGTTNDFERLPYTTSIDYIPLCYACGHPLWKCHEDWKLFYNEKGVKLFKEKSKKIRR